MKCSRCGCETTIFVPWKGKHYAKLICANCEKFLTWVSDPNPKEDNYIRNYSSLEDIKNKDPDAIRCSFCARTRDELGWNEVLEHDHIIPKSMGGKDIPSNMIIHCTMCHKLKHMVFRKMRTIKTSEDFDVDITMKKADKLKVEEVLNGQSSEVR